MPFRRQTADTCPLVSATVDGLKAIFRAGFNYAKTGVMPTDLELHRVNGTHQTGHWRFV
jgi:hypothetical protein